MAKYFTDTEIAGLDPALVAGADIARGEAGIPFVLTNTVRAATFSDPNAVRDSAHLTGHAFDASCVDNRALYLMLRGLYKANFNRLGLYFKPDPRGHGLLLPTHIHVDNDTTKSQDVMFCSMEW